MDDDFKYVERGSYHWNFTYNPQLRRFDPRNHARYDVPLGLLARHGALHTPSLGLEVGCGDGVLLYKAALAGARLIGIDLSKSGLELARKEIVARSGRSPELARASSYALPFRSGAFRYVLSVEVIEHLEHTGAYLSEIHRVLEPGGFFALTTPHRTADGKLQDPYHVREYDGVALSSVLRGTFERVEVYGMYPALLDRIYTRATGVQPVDKLVRAAIKVFAKWVHNPYTALREAPPPSGWANLAALCQKS